jgi:hypothetical protein
MAKKKDGGPTKAHAVREALKDGIDTPQDGVAYVKEKFGLDITAQQFSTYKSIEKSNKKKKKGDESGPAPARRSQPLKVPATASNPADLARQVKGLVQQYGAAAVSDMVAVFGE